MYTKPSSAASTSEMILTLDAVLERVTRELERVPSAGEKPSTVRVGGITKLGATLDAYLLTVWRWVCAFVGADPDQLARQAKPPIFLDRVTAGQLAYLLGDYVGSPVASEPAVRWIFAELRLGSALDRALKFRNQVVHDRESPDADSLRTMLVALQSALTPQRAMLTATM